MKLKSFSDIQKQSAVLAATTNRNFQHLLEEPVTISYKDNVIYVDLKKVPYESFHTSYIKSMEIFNHTLRVVTRNSVYVFVLKDKSHWDNSEVIEDTQKLEAQIVEFENNLKKFHRLPDAAKHTYPVNDASCSAPAYTSYVGA